MRKSKKVFIDKYLPHNFLAEKMILSCLITNVEAIEITLKTLRIDAFYFKNHQEIYKAIILMHENNLSIDILTLITFLQDNGFLQKIGGIRVLIELISQTPNLIYLKEYLSLVKDRYLRRSLIKLGYEMINSSYITNISLEHLLNELESKLFSLTNEIKSQNLFNSADILTTLFFELKKKSLNSQLSGLSSGFYDLDMLTQGFQNSDLIIIAGRPSMGKTALGLNIAINIIKNSKFPILFFSMEMSKEQIMYRLLSMESNIDQVRLKTGKLYQNDWKKLTKIIKIISRLPFLIDETSNLSIHDIRSKIRTIIFEQNQIGIIIIDYIQLMQNSKLKSENRVQELSQITRSLKNIAREFNIPIIALSQLSRNVENRINKEPILSDLRESGSIEQDADVVLFLHKNYSESQTFLKSSNQEYQLINLILAKQRNGPIGRVQLRFDSKRTKFLNLEQ